MVYPSSIYNLVCVAQSFPILFLDPVSDDFMLVTDFLNNEILQIPLTDPTKVTAIP